MSLYRHYRPKDFANLVGQDHVRITLLNAVKSGKLAHAYLFTGPRGTGKTSTARLLAKAINCAFMKEQGQCEGCELCIETDQGKLIDIVEIDAASNRGIDEMRDLREKIHYAPTRAPNKIYIIDEVHMLTKEAFNALLKTLEEPPLHVFFILATTEINKVPETIISRCQRFDFKRIDQENLLGRLQFVAEAEGIEVEKGTLDIIAKQARGGLRDALGLLEQITIDKKLALEHVQKILGISDFTAITELFEFIENGKMKEGIVKVQSLYQQGFDLIQFNRDFLEFLRQMMVKAVTENNSRATQLLLEGLHNFQEAYEKQKFAAIAELPLEIAVVKTCLKYQENSEPKPSKNISEEKKAVVANTFEVEVEAEKKKTREMITEKEKIIHEIVSEAKEEKASEEKNTQDVKAETEMPALSLEELHEKWAEVCAKINSPVVRSNLKASRPQAIYGQKLRLVFTHNFHKEKFFHPQFIDEAEQAILSLTGVRVSLEGVVDPTFKMAELKPINKIPENTVPEKNPLIDQALQIFGGEVI